MQFDKNCASCKIHAIHQKFIDLYDITIGDFIQTLLQQTWNRDYLMGRSKGHSLDNYELHL